MGRCSCVQRLLQLFREGGRARRIGGDCVSSGGGRAAVAVFRTENRGYLGRGRLRLGAPLRVLLLEAVRLLMTNELVVSLKHQQTLLALVIQAWGPLEAARTVVTLAAPRCHWLSSWLILVHLSGFLSSVLEPNHDHTRAQS